MVLKFIQSRHPDDKTVTRDRTCLGHELHISRCILLDLLCKGFIDTNVEIYTPRDRMFLYTKIFPHVFPLEEFKSDDENDDIVDMSEYMSCVNIGNRKHCSKLLVEMGYDNTAAYRSPEFVALCNTIDVTPISIKSPFAVIHFRKLADYTNNVPDLDKVIDWVRKKGVVDIVIFWNTHDTHGFEEKYERIVITNNLCEYASYMVDENCHMVVSEWSGGGQLSQFTTRGTVYYYFEGYPSNDYEKHYLVYYSRGNSSDATIYTYWDWKNTTDTTVVMVKDLRSLLDL